MNRRDFLKFLLATSAASYLDYEKLLWIPEKTIFIPTHKPLLDSQIVAMEIERILPYIRTLFERDDLFYSVITKK